MNCSGFLIVDHQQQPDAVPNHALPGGIQRFFRPDGHRHHLFQVSHHPHRRVTHLHMSRRMLQRLVITGALGQIAGGQRKEFNHHAKLLKLRANPPRKKTLPKNFAPIIMRPAYLF